MHDVEVNLHLSVVKRNNRWWHESPTNWNGWTASYLAWLSVTQLRLVDRLWKGTEKSASLGKHSSGVFRRPGDPWVHLTVGSWLQASRKMRGRPYKP